MKRLSEGTYAHYYGTREEKPDYHASIGVGLLSNLTGDNSGSPPIPRMTESGSMHQDFSLDKSPLFLEHLPSSFIYCLTSG